ncbi:MAG: rhomboid family intramembrane serine protease [Nitriliruptorales bacterium]|nr:rhomboid family intramembrane serine protease [Nitriliruptorales bacterium]
MSTQSVIPTCYRHPDRETRLSCSNCGRPVCVECVRPAAVGQRCLECATEGGGQRVVGMDEVTRSADRLPPVTLAVLVISAAVFAAGLLVPTLDRMIGVWLAQINPYVAQGEWWRLLSAAFLHGGFVHLAFNMYALYLFGPELERRVGSGSFAAMYVASAIAGGAAFYVAEPNGIAVGASGAVFGLFGAWLVASYRGRHTVVGRQSLRQLLILLGINAALGLMPGLRIAWQAHLGGLVAGAIITFLWTMPAIQRRPAARVAVAAVVGAVALAPVI